MPALSLTATPFEVQTHHPFKIARESTDMSQTALIRIVAGDQLGLGEAAPISRYGESVASVIAQLQAYDFGEDPFALERILPGLTPAARCGVDIALHDLIARQLGRPLWQLLGLDPSATPLTSFTIGMAPLEEMLAKVRAVAAHPVLKIKLGAGDEVTIIEAIRGIYRGAIRIDANEGWTPERAVAVLTETARHDIEFCEQPIPAGQPAQLRWIRERVDIPIVTDEDSVDAHDLKALVDCVDGINIKLAKCGGIRDALAMVHTARALGMKIMLGCMLETSILATAAAHLSPLVDWADLDGPFLIANDPFVGLTYADGKIVLPTAPGLGVRERSEVAA